jgi:hypothetical protein
LHSVRKRRTLLDRNSMECLPVTVPSGKPEE